MSHPNLPFVLNPQWPGHNELGWRGPGLAPIKGKGVRRLACVGASTTFGLYVEAEQAYPAQLGRLLDGAHGRWEAINAGVPGWVSTEIVTNLLLRVLPLDPDVVVILEGRNEVFPQAYEGFRADYTHYRRPGFNYAVSNFLHKEVFAWSRLAMLACTLRGDRFGWSERAEHPLYGGIVWENKPTVAQAERNLADPGRLATFERNLASMIAACQARGITALACTMAFRPEKLALDELDHDPAIRPLVAAQVEKNNDCVRAVARRTGAVLVETAALAVHPELFHDDCHMNAEGHRLRAELVFAALAPLLDRAK